MSRKRSTPPATKPVRDLDLPVPKQIQEEQLKDLFEAYDLDPKQRLEMTSQLKDLINAIGSSIKRIREQHTRSDDRKNLRHAIERLSEAQRSLKACGPIGQTIIINNISHFGEMLSAGWMRQAFPELIEHPKHTVQNRRLFARSLHISLVSAVLEGIQQSLERALRQSKELGGRRKAQIRHVFIMNLAVFWGRIGRDPMATGAFQFPQFCENVIEYVGWPASGLRATTRKALKDFATRS